MKMSNLLFEAPLPDPALQTLQPAPVQATTQPQNISLDAKLDRFLLQYERESAPATPVIQPQQQPIVYATESISSVLALLFEADDDANGPGDNKDMDLGGGDDNDPLGIGGGDDPLGGDDGSDEEDDSGPSEPLPPVPKLNVRVMASKLASLVSNYEALLDPKTVILNRARAFIQQNYDKLAADEFMNILALNYRLSPREPVGVVDGMSPEAPAMLGAGVGDLSSSPSSSGTVASGQ